MEKIAFHTIGCRLNKSETAVIEQMFAKEGYTISEGQESVDVVVINTCTVTAKGDSDTRRLVNKIHRQNPQAFIALIGCQAQLQGQELAQLPNVRWIVGNERKMQLLEILQQYPPSDDPLSQPCIINEPIRCHSFTLPFAGVDRKHTRANIKIQDGCDAFCSFCTIPYARGRARSREFADVIQEARTLAQAGHQELVLTGINIGSYAFEKYALLDVISALEQIESIKRIRLSSIEISGLNDGILNKMRPRGKLCRYLHVPLQHAHNEILKKMNRKYTIEAYQDQINRIHQTIPEICIGTDVIVGFPGETPDHFDFMRSLLEQAPIHYFHVFSYSQRRLSRSRELSGEVPIKTIQERSQILRRLSQQKRTAFFKQLLHTKQDVLFEQCKDHFWSGLTDHYARVKVKNEDIQPNQIRSVTITQVKANHVIGHLDLDS